MIEIGNCKLFQPSDYESHFVGTELSNCFYFPLFDLRALTEEMRQAGDYLVCRAARIEVSDAEDALHEHKGLTVVFIAAGSGIFRTQAREQPVRTGDWVVVPPNTPHLSVADPHTHMIEQIVYIGGSQDRQASHPVLRP